MTHVNDIWLRFLLTNFRVEQSPTTFKTDKIEFDLRNKTERGSEKCHVVQNLWNLLCFCDFPEIFTKFAEFGEKFGLWKKLQMGYNKTEFDKKIKWNWPKIKQKVCQPNFDQTPLTYVHMGSVLSRLIRCLKRP